MSIEIEDVYVKYRGKKDYALKGINLKVSEGEFIGVIGPTGAGKSTLCVTMNGLIPNLIRADEFRGNVIIDDCNTREHSVAELSERIGIVFQDYESQLFCTTVLLEVAFGPENLALTKGEIERRIEDSLTWTRLKGLEKRYTYSLSGGEKQRLAIAAVLSMRPKVVVLDEATSDLDPVGKMEIYQIIKQLKKKQTVTLVLVDHHLDRVAEIVDRVVALKEGEIVYEGAPREVFSHVDELVNMGLRPPQVTELFHRLKIAKDHPLTVKEAIERFPSKHKIKPPIEAPLSRSNIPAIEIRDLWHTYDGEKWVLKNINLRIDKGEFIALIGPNGSGKTTLAQCINGMVPATKGSIKIFGEEALTKSISELGKTIGYVFQNPDYQIFCNTVKDELSVGPKNLRLSPEEVDRRVKNTLKNLGIEHIADEDPFFLSKANRERVATAAILTLEPEIIILDEPTTGLCPGEVKKMMDLANFLNAKGKTIITITHDMWVVSGYCKRTLVLYDGQLLMDGPTRDVFSRVKVLKKCFIEPPQICLFTQELMGQTFLTVNEFANNVLEV